MKKFTDFGPCHSLTTQRKCHFTKKTVNINYFLVKDCMFVQCEQKMLKKCNCRHNVFCIQFYVNVPEFQRPTFDYFHEFNPLNDETKFNDEADIVRAIDCLAGNISL